MEREKRTEKAPVKVYLTKTEHERLSRLAKISGYSKSSYMKSLLKGLVPKPIPTVELIEFIYELNKIGVNLNQIAKVANMTGNIKRKEYDDNYRILKELMVKIRNEFLKPESKNGNNEDMGGKG